MSVTTVRLSPEIEQDLETTASKMQRSKSWVISEALREYIARNREGEASRDADDIRRRGRGVGATRLPELRVRQVLVLLCFE